jgi:hypothetical protein
MAYRYENNELTDMLLMHAQCYQNTAAASREYAKRFPERHRPGPRQLLILYSREIDRTGLKVLENNKNVQSIVSVNTNILLRRFRLKFLRIIPTSCYKNASTSKTPCMYLDIGC